MALSWMLKNQEPKFFSSFLHLPWDGVVVHFHEIALKRGQRHLFTKVLAENIKKALYPEKVKICFYGDRLLLEGMEHAGRVLEKVSKVFGIAYGAPVRFLEPKLEALCEAAFQVYKEVTEKGASFAIRVKKIDKAFPLSVKEMEKEIGAFVVERTNAPVNLTSPDLLISFRVYSGYAWLLGPKFSGPGGLPLGVTGRTLTLFSGGIDSPVAAWLVMRRGCQTDFVHFHAFRTLSLQETKISKLLEILLGPQGEEGKLFLAPYDFFQSAFLQSSVPEKLELIFFRRFMLRLAEQLALSRGYQALVSGDNLGQVASQTLENLTALDEAVSLPVFRPLLAFNKQEIIALAQKIGTYESSLIPYKDCCSLLSRHPETKAKLHFVKEKEKELPLERVLQQTLMAMEEWQWQGGKWSRAQGSQERKEEKHG